MKRRQPGLGDPPEGEKLAGFPRRALDAKTELFRVVRESHGPWWFNSSGAGRFDLSEPEGTCYLALDGLTAILEVIGPDRSGGMIMAEMLAERRLRKLRLPQRRSLADLTHRRAAGFGSTLEISSSPDYDLTQAWAKVLARAGSQGLLYHARHDPAAGESVAIFGASGERSDWDRGSEESLEDPRWLRRLWEECRIRVIARPRLQELTVLE